MRDAIAPIALAAASTGVVIPSLRALVEQSGHGSIAGGVFTAAHVLGGVIGAALGAAALRRAGSARRLALAALLASVAVTLAMAAVDTLEIRIGLRFVDGTCHLLAITALIAAATSGDAALRARSAVTLGIAIVLGVASGLGIGSQVGEPELALVVAALLSAGSLILVWTRLAAEPAPAAATVGSGGPASAIAAREAAGGVATREGAGGVATREAAAGATREGAGGVATRRDPASTIAPGLLAFGERFIFGALTAAMPFLATRRRVGLVLAVFMVTSVIALPVARRYALRRGVRRMAVRATLAFTAALAAAGVIDVLASPVAAVAWAMPCGAAAGALYASALVLAARSTALADRVRDMAAVHAAGSAGHALGALVAGVLVAVVPGMLAVVLPGIGIIAAATLGVWITVPDAARDCPVIGGLGDDEARVAIDA